MNQIFFSNILRPWTRHASLDDGHAVLAVGAELLRVERVRVGPVVDEGGAQGHGGGGHDVTAAVGGVHHLLRS